MPSRTPPFCRSLEHCLIREVFTVSPTYQDDPHDTLSPAIPEAVSTSGHHHIRVWLSLFAAISRRGVQPVGHMWPRMAMNAAQHKIVSLLNPRRFFFFGSSVFVSVVYLMCSPRQLFFHCGPETPKGWTPLGGMEAPGATPPSA